MNKSKLIATILFQPTKQSVELQRMQAWRCLIILMGVTNVNVWNLAMVNLNAAILIWSAKKQMVTMKKSIALNWKRKFPNPCRNRLKKKQIWIKNSRISIKAKWTVHTSLSQIPFAILRKMKTKQDLNFFDGCNECICNQSKGSCSSKICPSPTRESKSKITDFVCKMKLVKIEYHLAVSKVQVVDCAYSKHICKMHPGVTFSDGCKECSCPIKGTKRVKLAAPTCKPLSSKSPSCQYFGTSKAIKKLCKEKHKTAMHQLSLGQN